MNAQNTVQNELNATQELKAYPLTNDISTVVVPADLTTVDGILPLPAVP